MGIGDAMNTIATIEITTKDIQEAVQHLVVENINKQHKGGIKANPISL